MTRFVVKPWHSTAGTIVICVGCIILMPVQGLTSRSDARIYADPEVRISYDGDVAHMEAPIVASATDPNRLFAAGELLFPGRPFSHAAAQTYYSEDAGAQWIPVPLPVEAEYGGWDNAMAAGTGGTAYFITHDINIKYGLTTYRTHDGGHTWASAHIHAAHGDWDREYAIVDTTNGKYSGRLYIASENRGINGIGGVKVVSSSDGGKTFSPPAMACIRPGWYAEADPHPVVLRDGALIVPCFFYPRKGHLSWKLEEFGVVMSSDGGKTFSPFHRIAVRNRLSNSELFPMFSRGDLVGGGWNNALGVSPATGIHSDRLYMAWSSFESLDRELIYIAHSDNRGVTWSKPLVIDPVPSMRDGLIRQGVPMLAVNRNGAVGIAWFDARNAIGARGYDVYFSASVNGGESFLPSVRVTSLTSHPRDGITSAPLPLSSDDRDGDLMRFAASKDEKILTFASPYVLRWTGGDYSTMAVDAAGRFHPIWPDARDGTWQLYTSTIRVLSANAVAREASGAAQHASDCALGSKLRVLLGVSHWNPTAKEVRVAVQFENLSNETFFNPLDVRVSALKTKDDPAAMIFDTAHGTYGNSIDVITPVSVNHPLFPYGVTPPLTLRYHVNSPEQMGFSSRITINGSATSCPK